MRSPLLLIAAALTLPAHATASAPTTLLAGVARRDITGPIYDQAMVGFGEAEPKDQGLHTHLYARAFVFDDGQQHVAFVSADLGMISPWLRQQVLQRLDAALPGVFPAEDLVLSATHTHAGPAGYSVHRLYRIPADGYSAGVTATMADGIAEAVLAAWASRQPTQLSWSAGELLDASFNQSRRALLADPEAVQGPDRNTRMTQLRLETEHGLSGAISWFAVHPTTLGPDNVLVSGDNKGVAALDLEASHPGMVAAFPNADEGDISSDVWGPGDPADLFARTALSGARQATRAQTLLAAPGQPLDGTVDVRLAWVRMPGLHVDAADADLCRAALGESFAAGSEDGPSNIPGFAEGMVRGTPRKRPLYLRLALTLARPVLRGGPANTRCQGAKPILITTGSRLLRMTPEVLPFQLVRLGSLVIIAAPGEVTTVAGRRLRATVAARLAPQGVDEVVITGLSNSYAHYVTTAEEYALQQYEGASTLYGPHTLEAYQQIYDGLAASMVTGAPVATEPAPQLRERGREHNPGPHGTTRSGWLSGPGDVTCGQTLVARFASRHPKTGWDPVRIERQADDGWHTVVSDESPDTRLQWVRGLDRRRDLDLELRWVVPQDAALGTWRVVVGAEDSPPFVMRCPG